MIQNRKYVFINVTVTLVLMLKITDGKCSYIVIKMFFYYNCGKI